MSLATDLAHPIPTATKPCEFKAWLDTLPEPDRLAVRTALARKRGDPLYWSTPVLYRRLFDEGYQGSEATVYSHRAGGCKSCR